MSPGILTDFFFLARVTSFFAEAAFLDFTNLSPAQHPAGLQCVDSPDKAFLASEHLCLKIRVRMGVLIKV